MSIICTVSWNHHCFQNKSGLPFGGMPEWHCLVWVKKLGGDYTMVYYKKSDSDYHHSVYTKVPEKALNMGTKFDNTEL